VSGRREAHFLSIADWSRDSLTRLLDLADAMKGGRAGGDRPLSGRTLGMVFAKSSTRTRVSFEVGMYELGGHALFLSSADIQLGRGETISDTARVLSRYVDAVMIRTFAQSDVLAFAEAGSVPVINALTDRYHPCQVMSDLMTVREEYGTLDGLVVAWIGDGNNMANSWLNASARFGFELRLACPAGYEPNAEDMARAGRSTTVCLVRDPEEAVRGARVVTTDVWASMGQEGEAEERRHALRTYRVDQDLMALSNDAIFLHCLPAHRGEEVTDDVMDGPRSRVWDEAENRLHFQKALLLTLMSD
jgi:ornithine carbamoyltransferase